MSTARARRPGNGLIGQAVDRFGDLAVDPSQNVLQLTEAAVQRIDDMADLRDRLMDEKIKRMERESIHLNEKAEIRAEQNERLRQAEAARLDSIRQVDREDVNKTAAQALGAIQILQAQTNTTAETLRAQVANTATTIANQLTQLFAESNKRLSALELTSSEGRGKQARDDPQMERLTQMVEALAKANASGAGKSAGGAAMWGYVVGGFGFLLTLLGIGSLLLGAKP